MRILRRYILSSVFITTFYAVLFFTAIVLMLDLFTNLNTYLSNDIPLKEILTLSMLYIPKAVSFALSPALLFSVTFSISSLHSRNELVSVLTSGISYFWFIRSVLITAVLLCFALFVFQEVAVIDTYEKKQEYSSQLIGHTASYNNSHVVLMNEDSTQVLYIRYYNDVRIEANDMILISRDQDGNLTTREDIVKATYDPESGLWLLSGSTIYTIGEKTPEVQYISEQKSSFWFEPEDLRDITFDITQMRLQEARTYLQRIRALDVRMYRSLLTDYYSRFSSSFTPLIVILISISIGSRLRKNILLYSLLFCIIISVLYFIFEMVTILFAKQQFISPAAGAWSPVLLFLGISIILLRHVRT